MAPFFLSIISSSDHWLFVSSTGGLTAGRVSPETALFPYVPVDRVHDSALHTGSRTILRVRETTRWRTWEPYNREHDGRYAVTRNLYKNVLGNKLCFEEVNHDLQLLFRYTWVTSERFGFARRCELHNLGDRDVDVDLLDGLQNILPAGTPSMTQASASNLVDAYKWAELEDSSGVAVYTLYSGISDRAEPSESLRANTAFSLGLESRSILISSSQLDDFRTGGAPVRESHKRGVRGAYFVNSRLELSAGAVQRWTIVADIEQTQADVVDLIRRLGDPAAVEEALGESVDVGSDELSRIVAGADGVQYAAEEAVTAHHRANVLFNVLRGGVFHDQYRVSSRDFARAVAHFNREVHDRHRVRLESLPERMDSPALVDLVRQWGDPQLERLCYEYLPITFGRRHGDPSRPWNRFSIRLRDAAGDRILAYEGNWRDIFQNWEALIFSFPEFIEHVIAKFVNASTVDGYNPYRITHEGIDWEVEEPDDPWSYIGYWGDHQIIYLLKFLELSHHFHPARLGQLLRRRVFSYANVPYRIRPFEALLENPKATVDYDHDLAGRIDRRVEATGADGRLVLDTEGAVYLVNLLEKLLVPLLAKLGNLVVDGGIWLNTQRPEWNDANNALVGHGLSMATLYYMRRYVRFLRELLGGESEPVELSEQVGRWLGETTQALQELRPLLRGDRVDARQRFEALRQLGEAASRYRSSVYRDPPFSTRVEQPVDEVLEMLDLAMQAIDHSIRINRRRDGLYHAYNLMHVRGEDLEVDELYLMLEGQVAALSSGAIGPGETAALVEALFDSDVYREDQHSFMLYPDRQLPGFLEKNRIPPGKVEGIPLVASMLEASDTRLLVRDAEGWYRFDAAFRNVGDLDARLDTLAGLYGEQVAQARGPLRDLYEEVFNHRAFTGRSGGMFGFEGLGCIYWHMVSKLLLAVQEAFFEAPERGADPAMCERLGSLYYRIREGLGFNKGPAEFGAFPTDPYSHTPGHGGAQQPGMTGQVKEEVLSRFGELGLRVLGGEVRFDPRLLRESEFSAAPRPFRCLDIGGRWHDMTVPARGLAFTWCQVPVVYRLSDDAEPGMVITLSDGEQHSAAGMSLPAEMSSELFRRSGRIRQLELSFPARMLLAH
jgi:hypothetical protein